MSTVFGQQKHAPQTTTASQDGYDTITLMDATHPTRVCSGDGEKSRKPNRRGSVSGSRHLALEATTLGRQSLNIPADMAFRVTGHGGVASRANGAARRPLTRVMHRKPANARPHTTLHGPVPRAATSTCHRLCPAHPRNRQFRASARVVGENERHLLHVQPGMTRPRSASV